MENRAAVEEAGRANAASIRPRLIAVENVLSGGRHRPRHLRFNSATADRRGEQLSAADQNRLFKNASIRPRLIAVENRLPVVGGSDPVERASIRPRLIAVENYPESS